jgi:large subunit ribosomal protein L21
MFAVIETGGKQYLVKAGDAIKIEKLNSEVASKVIFDKVLLIANEDGTGVKIGNPYIAGAEVEAVVEAHGRSKKLRVVKYKRKVRYTRTIGHRQYQTKVKIKEIK